MRRPASYCLSLLLLTQLVPAFVHARQTSEADKRRRAGAAADLFIRRFRETLDFGRAFDETAVHDALRRLRRAGELKSFGMSERLAQAIDGRTAARFYKAFMNFVYLRTVHAVSLKGGDGDPDHVRLPKEFRRAIDGSKELRHIYSDSVADPPEAEAPRALRKFIADLERMSALFRKHLPRNVFESEAYRTSVARLERERGHLFEVYRGGPYFGVAEGVGVYGVCRDLFCFKFVEERGRMKVLGLVPDD